jgi:hypothetical protein
MTSMRENSDGQRVRGLGEPRLRVSLSGPRSDPALFEVIFGERPGVVDFADDGSAR